MTIHSLHLYKGPKKRHTHQVDCGQFRLVNLHPILSDASTEVNRFQISAGAILLTKQQSSLPFRKTVENHHFQQGNNGKSPCSIGKHWNIPIFKEKYIFHPGPFSSQRAVSLPERTKSYHLKDGSNISQNDLGFFSWPSNHGNAGGSFL